MLVILLTLAIIGFVISGIVLIAKTTWKLRGIILLVIALGILCYFLSINPIESIKEML